MDSGYSPKNTSWVKDPTSPVMGLVTGSFVRLARVYPGARDVGIFA